MNSRSLTLEEAKERVNIPNLWDRFNLPGKPSKSCRCPWREDRKPSFSVSDDGKLFNDFATGEGGDAVDFLGKVARVATTDACRMFLAFAGSAPFPTPAPRRAKDPKPKPIFPPLELGTDSDIGALSELRRIRPAGLKWAVERGVLRFCTSEKYQVRAYVVTDSEGVSAQARRLDGIGWEHLEGAKAWTLPGSWASWPIGIREAEPFPGIALCEGGPDFLAGHYAALRQRLFNGTMFAPVAMLGATLRIHESALELFRGKRVRIFAHDDDAGRQAAKVWAGQLASVGLTPDAYDFFGLVRDDGKPAKDLNDSLRLNPAGFEEMGEEMVPL